MSVSFSFFYFELKYKIIFQKVAASWWNIIFAMNVKSLNYMNTMENTCQCRSKYSFSWCSWTSAQLCQDRVTVQEQHKAVYFSDVWKISCLRKKEILQTVFILLDRNNLRCFLVNTTGLLSQTEWSVQLCWWWCIIFLNLYRGTD